MSDGHNAGHVDLRGRKEYDIPCGIAQGAGSHAGDKWRITIPRPEARYLDDGDVDSRAMQLSVVLSRVPATEVGHGVACTIGETSYVHPSHR